MIVQCQCLMYFDDEFRSTICPHETFSANDGKNNFQHYPRSYLSPRPPSDRLTEALGLLRLIAESASGTPPDEYMLVPAQYVREAARLVAP